MEFFVKLSAIALKGGFGLSLFALTLYGYFCALLFHLLPKRCRWVLLLAASLGFYAVRSLMGLPFLLCTSLVTWGAARLMGREAERERERLSGAASKEEKKAVRKEAEGKKRRVLILAVAVDLALLAVMKYGDGLLGLAGMSPLGLLLPLGISFYTFSCLGYLFDVRGGKEEPEKSPFRFLLFTSFFPQLIQGPIARHSQLAPQFEEPEPVDLTALVRATLLILWGLFKKMVIADRAALLVGAVFDDPGKGWGGGATLAAVLLYSLQQYCDFSGGIDLVTGIAELFGVRLAENFRRPYFSVSLADFWRRWHISLGSWMRDYVFYPFALSKPVSRLSKAVKKRYGATLARTLPAALGNVLVFLLVGLWHGAEAHFLLWGLYNGVVLAVSALLEPVYQAFRQRNGKLAESRSFYLFRVLRTFAVVNIGWFFDRCARAGDAVSSFLAVVTGRAGEALLTPAVWQSLGLETSDMIVLGLSALLLFFASLATERGACIREKLSRLPWFGRWIVITAGVVTVLLLGIWGSGFKEAAFLYYQF